MPGLKQVEIDGPGKRNRPQDGASTNGEIESDPVDSEKLVDNRTLYSKGVTVSTRSLKISRRVEPCDLTVPREKAFVGRFFLMFSLPLTGRTSR